MQSCLRVPDGRSSCPSPPPPTPISSTSGYRPPSPRGPIGQAWRLKLSAGIAELKAEDDGVSFFQRADEALYRAKDAGKGTAVASGEAESRAEWPRSAPGS